MDIWVEQDASYVGGRIIETNPKADQSLKSTLFWHEMSLDFKHLLQPDFSWKNQIATRFHNIEIKIQRQPTLTQLSQNVLYESSLIN